MLFTNFSPLEMQYRVALLAISGCQLLGFPAHSGSAPWPHEKREDRGQKEKLTELAELLNAIIQDVGRHPKPLKTI